MRALVSLCLVFGLSWGAAAELPQVVGKARTIQVVAGDSLYELGLRYGLAIEHFAFANNLPAQLAVARSGELTVPNRRILPNNPPAEGLVVNLPERGVFLFRNGSFDKFYPVAIGQPGRFATPTGQFELVSRVKDPTWMPPEWAGLGKDTVVPAGANNPLGDRWMGLSMSGLGLHSTTQPTSIGQAASHGCMRMYPAMSHDLFDRVKVGMPVRIEYEPVKLGRDPETGSLCLSIFPDVYGRCPLLPRAHELLAAAGVQDWLDEKTLARWVANPQGLPQTFAEGQVGLQFQGQEIGEPGLLLKSSQGIYASIESLRRLGVTSVYDPATKSVTLTNKEISQSYLPTDGVVLDGKLYLPVRLCLPALSINYHWDGPQKSLVID
ncbi:L,D-transpeptidase [bacterium]|nr:L,D-transpeptidase [bacterium]